MRGFQTLGRELGLDGVAGTHEFGSPFGAGRSLTGGGIGSPSRLVGGRNISVGFAQKLTVVVSKLLRRYARDNNDFR
jgi:hypothetical protein